ncbi:hypothetical protein NC661_15225 [Aquibacillus koreensis]|uniref:Uncharacterized protein n=1 Tax=Aquibacillus koreensis TaxID=279446 RepID=A0A9X3WMZ1_9BACI|nr:hypothetical protein [Aquibacillus koreensis]MCT2534416.1 hypothetical protein [Aquibacillus koreensis]MDC3421723.1 hypothetical protein [Aquibacillus koreensis]
MEFLMIILVIAVVFCSIAAWVNTKIILRDIAKIKERLEIVEEEPTRSGFTVDEDGRL